jgi:hypothetical protein
MPDSTRREFLETGALLGFGFGCRRLKQRPGPGVPPRPLSVTARLASSSSASPPRQLPLLWWTPRHLQHRHLTAGTPPGRAARRLRGTAPCRRLRRRAPGWAARRDPRFAGADELAQQLRGWAATSLRVGERRPGTTFQTSASDRVEREQEQREPIAQYEGCGGQREEHGRQCAWHEAHAIHAADRHVQVHGADQQDERTHHGVQPW